MSRRQLFGNTRWRLLATVVLLTSLVLALPLVRLTLLGWLRGDPCYCGMPLAFWRYQLTDWRIEHGRRPERAEERLQEKEEKAQGIEFVLVLNYPGEWTLEHRDTQAQKWYDWWQRRSNWENPVYGTLCCRLRILDGDPAAVPVWTALLTDEDVRIRRVAAATIGLAGPQAKAAFGALLDTANHDKDAFLRGIARTTLFNIDKEAAEKAGIVNAFIFWWRQPRLLATIKGSFFLDSPTALLAEGKIFAFDDRDKAITLHDLPASKVLATFQLPTDCGPPIVFSPDGKSVASVSTDKLTVKVRDLGTGKTLATLRGHTGVIKCLVFSPDGKTLASGSEDKTVKLWAVSTGTNIATLRAHTDSVSAVAFSPDGRMLASGGEGGKDPTVRIWDVVTHKQRAVRHHDRNWGGVECLAFSPDGKTLASGSLESAAMLIDVVSGKEIATLDDGDESGSLDSVAFSPNGQALAYVSWDKIFLCDVAKGKTTAKIRAEPGNVDGAVFTPDGRMLAVTRGRDGHGEMLWEFAGITEGKK
jgi:hypothetical protein